MKFGLETALALVNACALLLTAIRFPIGAAIAFCSLPLLIIALSAACPQKDGQLDTTQRPGLAMAVKTLGLTILIIVTLAGLAAIVILGWWLLSLPFLLFGW